MAIGRYDRERAAQWVRDRLGVSDPNTPIGVAQIDRLADVSAGTAQMWRSRSRKDWTRPGKLRVPMPEPRPELEVSAQDTGIRARPRWRALDDIMFWLWDTDRWYIGPCGAIHTAGRPGARHEASDSQAS